MILLDTHVVIWLMMDQEQLSVKLREAIVKARIEGESLAYSPLSLYEIAYAAGRKRLRLNSATPDFIAAIEAKWRFLASKCFGNLSPYDAAETAELHKVKSDPGDRGEEGERRAGKIVS